MDVLVDRPLCFNIPTFQKWVSVKSGVLKDRNINNSSVDKVLDLDMFEYTVFLDHLVKAAKKELKDSGFDNGEPRNDNDRYLLTIKEKASSRCEGFISRAEEIRSRYYNFCPGIPGYPTFHFFFFSDGAVAEFGALETWQEYHIHDAYQTLIASTPGPRTAQVLAAYVVSRERRTEADRRELYGLSRKEPETISFRMLNLLRDECRELWIDIQEMTEMPVDAIQYMAAWLNFRIRLVRCYISTEFDIDPVRIEKLRCQVAILKERLSGDLAALVPHAENLALEWPLSPDNEPQQ